MKSFNGCMHSWFCEYVGMQFLGLFCMLGVSAFVLEERSELNWIS